MAVPFTATIWPGTQVFHCTQFNALVEAENFPSGQLMQLRFVVLEPLVEMYVPLVQFRQFSHLCWFHLSENLPLTHFLHV